MLYPGSRFRMADELLEEYVRQLIEAHSQVPEVTIAWQGGEPTLMGLDFFRRSVELAEPVPPARTARRLHDPDERDAARRGLGPVLQGERLPGRRLDRRAARAARRLSRRQGRQGQLRQGRARARMPCGRPGSTGTRSRRSMRSQRRPRPGGLSVPARRAATRDSSSSSRSSSESRRRTRTEPFRGRRGATGRSTCRRAMRSPGAP